MERLLFALLGLALGALGAWVWARGRARADHAAAAELRRQLEAGQLEAGKLRTDVLTLSIDKAAVEARAQEARAAQEAERALLEQVKARLTETFRALAADALTTSQHDFLALAEQRFRTLAQEAGSDLEARQTAIETLVQPLKQSLEVYQKEARELEEKRLRETAGVGQQLSEVARAQTALQRETANLVTALRAPQVRGRWGEIALRKTAELAGMTNHCDFVEQESLGAAGGRLRPDMIVRLPAGREIVVDSKVSLMAYLEAVEASTPEAREAALARHAQQVRTHVKQLASKEYWGQFQPAPEFVVLFMPEPFFAAAAERDPELLQDALANHVLVATPTTFIGLLRTIAYGWREEQLAENAQRICELGRQVHERLANLIDHFGRVGKALEASVEAYNRAVGSLESRVLPAARRFAELGAAEKALPPLAPLSQTPRLPLGHAEASED
ncbi:MAG TPA: DNA recombination protein RmuC [Candidatus Sulfotelmatobacter sp.]|nr:DNA recombination protein RmuC [Candidatus Sulfotelmatobacter sp.]